MTRAMENAMMPLMTAMSEAAKAACERNEPQEVWMIVQAQIAIDRRVRQLEQWLAR